MKRDILPFYIGIMANESSDGLPPFAESPFYARLCRIGQSLGLVVYVFSLYRVHLISQQVTGYTYISKTKGWEEQRFPLPDLIYDRCFFVRKSDYIRHQQALRKLLAQRSIPFLGRGIRSKWHMAAYLSRVQELRPYLPRTMKYTGFDLLRGWLQDHQSAFLKPISGSQGKGACSIRCTPEGYLLQGRDSSNRKVEQLFRHKRELEQYLDGFIQGRSYLLQQYLELATSSGEAWDVRSLVQKNGRGLWEHTGMAIRKGISGSVTSNLSGGGSALEVRPFLKEQFGAERAATIESTLRWLSEMIPPALEASNGRMAELGLDLGVDRQGRVWIIEANTKPGRSVFHRLNQRDAQLLAAANPMAYARYLLRGPLAYHPSRSSTREADSGTFTLT